MMPGYAKIALKNHFLKALSKPVEGLYCKRPIQCLPSSEIFARRMCTPTPLVREEDTLARGGRGWGVNSSEDARHCSVLYICKYFVSNPYGTYTQLVYFWPTCPFKSMESPLKVQ